LQKTLKSTGDNETAIILRGGATAELSSGVTREHATLIAQSPGILRDAEGKPIVSAELVVVANLPKKSTGTDANVEVRGVGPQVWALRPNIRIVEGRRFTPGLREMIRARRSISTTSNGRSSASSNPATRTNRNWKAMSIRSRRPTGARDSSRSR
jgi:putative ABC transport system permease protein